MFSFKNFVNKEVTGGLVHYRYFRFEKKRIEKKTKRATTKLITKYENFGWTTDKWKGKCFAFYIVENLLKKGDERFVLKEKVAFSKRWKAKDRAYKWYCKREGHDFHSLHTKRKTNPFQKVYICQNNMEIENFFDEGEEYLGMKYKDGNLLVEDKYGKHKIVTRFRFKEKENE